MAGGGGMKKIMFNDRCGLTAAVLEGRKTMTRRIVKPTHVTYRHFLGLDGQETLMYDTKTWRCCLCYGSTCVARSQYAVDEVVAVAQNYADVINEWSNGWGDFFYDIFPFGLEDRAGMNNKMFVRADYMPHQINITNIRVERLQDISDEDCLREGIYKHDPIPSEPKFVGYSYDATIDRHKPRKWFDSPREAFAALIDKVSGKGTWDKNPLVFVYEFELIK